MIRSGGTLASGQTTRFAPSVSIPFSSASIFFPLEPAGIVPATHNQLVRLRPSHPKEYVLTSLVPERVTRASWNLSFKVASVYQMLPSMIRGPHRMWIRSCMVRGKLPDSIMHPMRFLDVKKVSTSPHRQLGGAGILSTLPSSTVSVISQPCIP